MRAVVGRFRCSIISARSSIVGTWCAVAGTWGTVAGARCSVACARDPVVVSRWKIGWLWCCVVPVDTMVGVVWALGKQALHSVYWVGDALECVVHVIVGRLVTAKNATAVGGEVEIDKRLESKFAIVVGGSLEAEEGVEVDGSNFNAAICSGVVGIDSTSSSNRVLLVATVARTSLRKAERDANCWLQLPIGCRPCDEVRESAKKTLGRKQVRNIKARQRILKRRGLGSDHRNQVSKFPY